MAQLFQRMLLASERTEFDAGAERVALALAKRCQRPLGVVMPLASNAEYEAVAPQLAAQADRDAAARLQPLREQARAAGVEIELGVRRGAEAWREIVDEAQERGADLLVIRRRGRRSFLARLLVGEMVAQVVAHAPSSVLVVPRDAGLWTRRVLLAAESGAAGEASLQLALAVATECTLPLHLLCTNGSGAEGFVADAVRRARHGGLAATGEVLAGATAAQILEAARHQGADLLVLERGSVAHDVTGRAECAVLLTPHRAPKKDLPT
jgi:nucleotide-binding universal stress UspA family protein